MADTATTAAGAMAKPTSTVTTPTSFMPRPPEMTDHARDERSAGPRAGHSRKVAAEATR